MTQQQQQQMKPEEPPQHQPPRQSRKRKATSHDGDRRLSKRLSLLNLEQSGPKLYVPVETPAPTTTPTAQEDDDRMQIDDSKHKIYIYNVEDELSSDSEHEDGRLVFLSDLDRHLRRSRIPPTVLANPEGELAGMQMVLYNDPRSLTVPEDRDGVRRAILDARHRLRERQRREREGLHVQDEAHRPRLDDQDSDPMDVDVTSPDT
ncbi:hypothetical protein L249_1282 [Ophiocordyceps polyrhachis-furcata BCC 54312]|uniref:Uncharacterized protein n=1 Tax=Ophiocordyceps polyrhachis-furcata BCC 54312 TaxID=1330021 RepID=A0A367LFB3_9HYPO|nr:hypothetical protein L249_1282 [Ophiocordyceps polyrhachis-furcata BCC 54312]